MAKIVVHANGPLASVCYESGTVLATGVRDESDVLPALETSQFSGRNRLMCVIHRMCYDQSLQCSGTADGSLKSV